MGYVHFVRSPYAHAKIVSIDVVGGARARRRLRDADRRRGRDPDRSVLRDVDAARARTSRTTRSRSARCATWASRSPPSCAATRELARDAAELVEVEYEPLDGARRRRGGARRTRPCSTTRPARTSSGAASSTGATVDAALAEADHVVKIDELHFHRFTSTPLECAGALVEYDSGTGQWTLHCNHQMPGVGAIWMAPALRTGHRQAPLRHAGHRRRLRQQDLPAPAATSRSACSRGSSTGRCSGRSGAPTSTRRTRTATSAGSTTSRSRVKADGTMLGFKVKALDDCGAFPRYEPLGCIIWAQVTPGLLRAGGTSASTSRRCARTSRRSRRTAATRGCSTSG